MRKFLESWGGAVAFAAAVAGGAWWIAISIGQARADLTTEIHALEVRVESRLSAVEAKLDLLIEGLDIQIGEGQ